MTIYVAYSKSHEVFKPWFESIYKIYPEINIKYFILDQKCQTGEFREQGWDEATRQKLKKMLEAFNDPLNKDEYFIFSDIDIQFFNKFDEIIENLLQDNDFLFQNDHAAGLCTGFFVAKKNRKVKKILKNAIKYFELGDQPSIQEALRRNPKVKYKLLPDEFFTIGLYCGKTPWKSEQERKIFNFKIPDNIIMHHANWTNGIKNKLRLLSLVKYSYEKINHE
jgi:hypothetical protein